MTSDKIFKVIMKQGPYDILSADTGFYAFMDTSRLYYTFDKLISEGDLNTFLKRAEALEEGNFILHLMAVDGSTISYYASLERGMSEGQLLLNLIDIVKLIEAEKNYREEITVQKKLLELYGDDLFMYYPDNNELRLITKYGIVPESKCMTLEEFEVLLRGHVQEERYEDVSEFIRAIRTGNRYFEICVDGNIVNDEQGIQYTIIKGASIYENGESIMVAGFIHEDMQRVIDNVKKVELDSLTGLLSKGEITKLAIRAIDVERCTNISIAIVDVDYFKKVNDTYGHLVGDETLKKVAAIIEAEVGNGGVVGRIGGDEFFIMYYDVYDLEIARERLRSIKNTVLTTFPVNDDNRPVITLSMGCASYPKDADNYSDLFSLADFALYRAKENGRNRYIIYDKEKHGTLAQIHKTTKLATRINNRGNMSKGDILCVIMNRVFGEEMYPLEKLLDDYIENFEPQRITIYDADKAKVLYMTGARVPSEKIIEETQGYILSEFWQKKYVYDDIAINNISIIENTDKYAYELMKKQGIISCVHIKFQDKNGSRCILSLESVTKRVTWSNDYMHYYKLMARTLSQYVLVNHKNSMI